MEDLTALTIVQALCDGLNPFTGEELAQDHIFQEVRITRALFQAARALERSAATARRKAAMPKNSGRLWTSSDERSITDLFEQGVRPTEIASMKGRSSGSIIARLVHLGKIDEQTLMSK